VKCTVTTAGRTKRESIADITTKIQSYKIDRGWRWRDPTSGKWKDLCRRGFADNAIGEEHNEFSVAVEFERSVRINGEMHPGIKWELVSKPPGSRVTGFALTRERLIATAPRPDSWIREAPGLFVVKDDCPNFVRTVPVLPRSTKNPDDVNSESEDHIFDAVKHVAGRSVAAHEHVAASSMVKRTHCGVVLWHFRGTASHPHVRYWVNRK
jgi:hypothetical protein